MTPFRQVQWDGCGINDTDQFASRIAKFQNDYLSFGPEMVRRWNAYEGMLKELHRVAEDMNTLVDNDKNFDRAQRREVFFAIQSNVCNAITKAEGK